MNDDDARSRPSLSTAPATPAPPPASPATQDLTPVNDDASVRRTALVGAWTFIAFWLLAMTGIYFVVDHFHQADRHRYDANISTSGEIVIPRARDGHFYVDGRVGDRPVRFMIDTGATSVAITEALARSAGLEGGTPIVNQTANGDRPGRLHRSVLVEAGGLSAGGVSVVVGLSARDSEDALLGQSFLSRFAMSIDGERMVLRVRERQ